VKIFATFVLVLTSLVPTHADTVLLTVGEIFIPDGSTITSEVVSPCFPAGCLGEVDTTVYFTFADGSGYATNNGLENQNGEIDFNSLVTNLSFTWIGQISFEATVNGTNGGTVSAFNDFIPPTGTSFFLGPIASIDWQSQETTGGIESLSFTDPPMNAPEPSTLTLLTVPLMLGLMRWAQMSLRKLSEH